MGSPLLIHQPSYWMFNRHVENVGAGETENLLRPVGRISESLLVVLIPALGGLAVGLLRRVSKQKVGGYAMPGFLEAVNLKAAKLSFQNTLLPPKVNGDPKGGDLLIVGWGSTKGAIEGAVERARKDGLSVSSLHLTFLSPLEPGLKEIFARFKKVMTVEINYSDPKDAPFINDENRRRGQLSWLLRATTLVDVDCWTRVLGEPLRPGRILQAIRQNMPGGTA